MEHYMHILAVPCSENPNLLRFFVFFLQRNHCRMSNLRLRMPKQQNRIRRLSRVSHKVSNFVSFWFQFFFKTTKSETLWHCSPDTPHLASVVSPPTKKGTILPPLVQCTRHLCPIRVHWHVKQNYKEYWRVKITITNFNYRLNYSQWNMVAQHPNLDNITQIFSFNYKSLSPYAGLSKTHTSTLFLSHLLSLWWIIKIDSFFFFNLQTIRRCCGEWSSTTTSYQKQGLLGMCSLRFCSVWIKQRLRLR